MRPAESRSGRAWDRVEVVELGEQFASLLGRPVAMDDRRRSVVRTG
ncbi:MAG: hypothetical protein MZU97_11375 [Bacillus subtilis]|nr:hypothetical protein [Bacillus subtilis]